VSDQLAALVTILLPDTDNIICYNIY
jgi:hypothetical protein